MKNTKFFISILLLLQTIVSFGQQKSMNYAREVAVNWFSHFAPQSKANDIIISSVKYVYHDTATFYIFNFTNGGYVLTSADNRVKPVLAYDFSNIIDTNMISDEVQEWLDLYGNQICYVSLHDVISNQANIEWNNLENNNFSYLSTNDVPALLEEYQSSRWTGWTPYFSQVPCEYPSDWPIAWGHGKGDNGCVPIAMSQIMKFHKFPINGNGAHSYTSTRSYVSSVTGLWTSVSCNVSATFSDRTYDYNLMPFRLTYCGNGQPGCNEGSLI